MPVIYNSKKIIPAGFISIARANDRKPSGRKSKAYFSVTYTGTLVSYKGSPRSDGTFYGGSGYPADESIAADSMLSSLRNKIGALYDCFADDNKWFEVQPWDGSQPIKFLARVKDVNVQEGQWFDRANYTVTMECDCIWFGSVQKCAYEDGDPLDESWDIEPSDESGRAYRVTRTLSCQMTDLYDDVGALVESGFERAKTIVVDAAGWDSGNFTAGEVAQVGVLDITGWGAYNRVRQVSENVTEGSYRLVETYLCYFVEEGDEAAIEDYTLTARSQAGKVTVSAEGSIAGLVPHGDGNATGAAKFVNAWAKWEVVNGLLLSRCTAVAGIPLNPSSINYQVVTNENLGTVGYSVEFDSRTTFGITGALSVSLSLQDKNPSDVFANIGVIAKPGGPLLQDLETVSESRRVVAVDVIFAPPSYGDPTIYPAPNVAPLIDAYAPAGAFVDDDQENFQISEGRYSRTVSFTFI